MAVAPVARGEHQAAAAGSLATARRMVNTLAEREDSVKRQVLVTVVVLVSVLCGYVAGRQRTGAAPAGSIVYSGEDFGFRVTGSVGDLFEPNRGWVTGSFVVKVDGRWVEARMGGAARQITE